VPGAISFVAATAGGGMTINDSQQGVIQLDSSGNAGAPVASLQGAVPIYTVATISDFSDAGVGPWDQIASGNATEVTGAIEDALSPWPGPRGALEGQGSAAAHATPTKFSQTGEYNLIDGTLLFFYSWSSSTGKESDLALCEVGETVNYPGAANPYVWPSPMVATTPNPLMGQISARWGGSNDHNYAPPSYSKPYSSAAFQAAQQLWWSCPYVRGGARNNFVPTITINRQVFLDADGYWKYQATKSGYTGYAVRLPSQ
jgi:hypothetical protein